MIVHFYVAHPAFRDTIRFGPRNEQIYKPARFGILARLSDPEPVRSAIERLAERESAAFRLRFGSAPVSLGSSLESALAIAEKRLCENRLAYVDHLL